MYYQPDSQFRLDYDDMFNCKTVVISNSKTEKDLIYEGRLC